MDEHLTCVYLCKTWIFVHDSPFVVLLYRFSLISIGLIREIPTT